MFHAVAGYSDKLFVFLKKKMAASNKKPGEVKKNGTDGQGGRLAGAPEK